MAPHRVPAILAISAALLAACTSDDRASTPLDPPSFSHGENHALTGAVLGPDGANLCNTLDGLGVGGTIIVRPINPATGAFAGFNFLVCPQNAFSFSVAPGSYLLRAQLSAEPALGTLPWRNIESDVVVEEDVTRDMHVLDGAALAGSATFDGRPLEGVLLNIVYDAAPGFGATLTTSGPDGRWTEFFGRTPPVLQTGVRYRAAGACSFLGAKVLESPPGAFVFPTDVSAINCTLETAPAVRFSHDLTRMVVTPMPAELGGQCQGAPFTDLGIGFGVQFPVADAEKPPHRPSSATHLFCGGLLVGVSPDVVLSGVDISGYGLACAGGPEACQDLGQDGRLRFGNVGDDGSAGKKVTWVYSDDASTERIGLEVTQRSFDGTPPADYVLFRYSFQNRSRATVSIYAGVFADWDVDEDFLDDAGATELGGRLMYAASTNPDDRGTHVGTLFLSGVPPAGTLFFNNATIPQSLEDQVRALSGALTRPTLDPPGDLRAVHSVGPIMLRGGQRRDVWLAIVGGENRAQLLANAAAAEADVARRLANGDDGEASAGAEVWSSGTAAGTRGTARSTPQPFAKRPPQ